jgi:hypothetical protein
VALIVGKASATCSAQELTDFALPVIESVAAGNGV